MNEPEIPSAPLYPKIMNEKEINNLLNDSRIKEMLNQRNQLINQLQHYKKLKYRWDTIDKTVKFGGIVVIGLTSTACIVLGAMFPTLLIIPIIFGASNIAESSLFGAITVGLTEKKKKHFNNKIKIMQSYIDKLFHYIELTKEDRIITIEELNGFRKIMDEYYNEINKVQFDVPKIQILELQKQLNELQNHYKPPGYKS